MHPLFCKLGFPRRDCIFFLYMTSQKPIPRKVLAREIHREVLLMNLHSGRLSSVASNGVFTGLPHAELALKGTPCEKAAAEKNGIDPCQTKANLTNKANQWDQKDQNNEAPGPGESPEQVRESWWPPVPCSSHTAEQQSRTLQYQ